MRGDVVGVWERGEDFARGVYGGEMGELRFFERGERRLEFAERAGAEQCLVRVAKEREFAIEKIDALAERDHPRFQRRGQRERVEWRLRARFECLQSRPHFIERRGERFPRLIVAEFFARETFQRGDFLLRIERQRFTGRAEESREPVAQCRDPAGWVRAHLRPKFTDAAPGVFDLRVDRAGVRVREISSSAALERGQRPRDAFKTIAFAPGPLRHFIEARAQGRLLRESGMRGAQLFDQFLRRPDLSRCLKIRELPRVAPHGKRPYGEPRRDGHQEQRQRHARAEPQPAMPL